jgi:tripartite-type tricarboxylate transporter receptor subunit TctC
MKKGLLGLFAISLSLSMELAAATGATDIYVAQNTEQKNAGKGKINYPVKPIELVLPFAAGGSADMMLRALINSLKDILPKPVIAVYRVGAGGTIGTKEVARGKADGYTILFNANGVFATQPHLRDVGYSADDFRGIIGLSYEPILLATHTGTQWKSLDQVMEAKQTGKAFIYGHAGAGSLPHLAQAAFFMKAGMKAESVPFQGGGPAVTAILGGHIDFIAALPAELLPHVEAGKLRFLAVYSPKRLEMLPEVPTLKEKGIDLDMSVWKFVLAPKGTPDEVVEILRVSFKKAFDSASFQGMMKSTGLIPQFLTGDEVIAKLKAESNTYVDVIKYLGIGKKRQ